MHSWRVLLLPYLEEQRLYAQYDFSQPWDSPHNRKLLEKRPRTFVFPGGDPKADTTTNYLAITGHETIWRLNDQLTFDDLPNPRNVILVTENTGSGIQWTEPRDLSINEMTLSVAEDSPNGISTDYDTPAVVMADSSTDRLERATSPETIRSLITVTDADDREDANVVELPNGRERPPGKEE